MMDSKKLSFNHYFKEQKTSIEVLLQ